MRQKAKKNWLSTAVVVDFVLHLYCFGGWKDARAHKVALIYALQPDTSFDHETTGLVRRVVCPFTSTVFAVVPVAMEEWPGPLTWMACYIPVTHPSTNRSRRRISKLVTLGSRTIKEMSYKMSLSVMMRSFAIVEIQNF